ncbi:MAG: nucleotidyl transferase AbiEii/AbiGii toxin family protein [Prevotellaceae bacterium]|jgi:hypothetical protein|nr:nucleotidyl transferase AbiEii/AbiGii toxin family protein [Prevotellaceae bacterium]
MQSDILHLQTVSPQLRAALSQLMSIEILSPFRLVGGTALSLQLGHRMSVDIDLFTDAEYGSIDFKSIDCKIMNLFPLVEMQYKGNDSFGKSYFIGSNKNDMVKVDLFYTDKFIEPIHKVDVFRLATLDEIAAMKMEVIGHSGRKKDFWDIHELLEIISLDKMIELHNKRYPYSYTTEELKAKLVDFSYADPDFEPICLKDKYWELIRLDIETAVSNLTV